MEGPVALEKRIVRGVCLWKPNPGFSEQVLLIFEDKCWKLPGGHIESGEWPRNALTREFLEETQLKIEILVRFFIYTTSKGKEGFFLVRPGNIKRAYQIASETKNVAWFSVDHLPLKMPWHYKTKVEKALSLFREHCPQSIQVVCAEKQ